MIPYRQLNLSLEKMYTLPISRNEITIAVTRLRMKLEKDNHQRIQIPVCAEEAQRIKARGLIDRETLVKLKPEELKVPCIQVLQGNEYHLVDGHYQYIYAYVAGRQFLPLYQVKPIIWRQYVVNGVPR